MPSRKPIIAGNTAHRPESTFISIAGNSKDQKEAATITPAANPRRDFCNRPDISRCVRKTTADPRTMPSIGTNNPIKIVFIPAAKLRKNYKRCNNNKDFVLM